RTRFPARKSHFSPDRCDRFSDKQLKSRRNENSNEPGITEAFSGGPQKGTLREARLVAGRIPMCREFCRRSEAGGAGCGKLATACGAFADPNCPWLLAAFC